VVDEHLAEELANLGIVFDDHDQMIVIRHPIHQ
jgi:hypothetical protein